MKNGFNILGIGGIFFKSRNPEKINEWYRENFGFNTDKYGTMFHGKTADESGKDLFLQWAPLPQNSYHFEYSNREFIINYIVEGIEQLVNNLRAKGVQVLGNIEEFEYGKFVHLLDPENNKIELWEPNIDIFGSVERSGVENEVEG